MAERIDRKLRLIIELPRGENPSLYVHSEAMDANTFEQYFDLCGPTMNALVAGGYGYVAPRYAALMFRKVAMAPLVPEPPQPDETYARAKLAIEGRVAGFFNELHRLTNVMALKDDKWEMTLVSDAVALGAVSQEEYSRIDSTLVFFTCAAQSVPLDKIEATLGGLSLFNSRTEFSNATAFMNFLQTLTQEESSGEKTVSSPEPSNGSSPMPDSKPSSAASMNPNSHGEPRRRTGIVITRPQ